MSHFVLTDAHIIVNSVVLSDHANQVSVTDNRDQVDLTAFGASNKVYGKGLGDGTMQITFFQDFAAGEVHATLQPLIGSSTPVTVEVRATSAVRSATNPAAVMSALLFSYEMINGAIGAGSTITATFQNASQAGITYPVA